MVRVSTDGDLVTVRVLGWHAFWACRRSLTVPRSAIRSVRMAREAGFVRPEGFRMPGTYVPGLIAAGTFCGRRTVFWDVRHLDRAVAIELDGQKWSHLILEVDDPATVMHQLAPRGDHGSGAVAQFGARAAS